MFLVSSFLLIFVLFVTGTSWPRQEHLPYQFKRWNSLYNGPVRKSFTKGYPSLLRKSFVLENLEKYSADTESISGNIIPRIHGTSHNALTNRKEEHWNEGRNRHKRSGQKNCSQLSKKSNCTQCGFRGICRRGTACISEWLALALKTQWELQVDAPLNHIQMLGAHNAFNNRASGYGDLDDCPWPPPYRGICVSLANQELSFTDLLNIGIQSLEIDPWYCYGKIRMSHSYGVHFLGCMPWDRELEDGLKEIAAWANSPENTGKIIQIYFDDHRSQTQGNDELINGLIRKYFGTKVLTPKDLREHFNGKWPSPRKMRKLKKMVWFVSGESHKGLYIHTVPWKNLRKNELHDCDKQILNGSNRAYSDSTRYGPLYDGPSKVGVILNFTNLLTCGVNFPAADQVTPELMKTAVYTWAENEPKVPLSTDSCVLLSGKELRWHVADCSEKHWFACVSKNNENLWAVSTLQGVYGTNHCPDEFTFSIPHNAVQHRKLAEVTEGKDVWLNFTPFISIVSSEAAAGKCT